MRRPLLALGLATAIALLAAAPPASAALIKSLPLPGTVRSPDAIVAGPDGALWFTQETDRIGRITTAGAVSQFRLPSDSEPDDLAAGPDGAVWYSGVPHRIGRITAAGAISEFPLPLRLKARAR